MCIIFAVAVVVHMFVFIVVAYASGSRASHTKNRKIPPQRYVYLFAVAVVVRNILFRMQQGTERSV